MEGVGFSLGFYRQRLYPCPSCACPGWRPNNSKVGELELGCGCWELGSRWSQPGLPQHSVFSWLGGAWHAGGWGMGAGGRGSGTPPRGVGTCGFSAAQTHCADRLGGRLGGSCKDGLQAPGSRLRDRAVTRSSCDAAGLPDVRDAGVRGGRAVTPGCGCRCVPGSHLRSCPGRADPRIRSDHEQPGRAALSGTDSCAPPDLGLSFGWQKPVPVQAHTDIRP